VSIFYGPEICDFSRECDRSREIELTVGLGEEEPRSVSVSYVECIISRLGGSVLRRRNKKSPRRFLTNISLAISNLLFDPLCSDSVGVEIESVFPNKDGSFFNSIAMHRKESEMGICAWFLTRARFTNVTNPTIQLSDLVSPIWSGGIGA